MLTVGSLFSGIGGLELGLEMTGGFRTVWQVEIDEYASKVLERHWPGVSRYRDIRECGAHNLERVDLICGGFPCQPHSVAGKRKASADERDLWGEFYRIICEVRPRWVLAENVPGLLSSEHGRFFGRVLRDLAQAGYDARWGVLSAADMGAPHLRKRVFIVAHADTERWDGRAGVFGQGRRREPEDGGAVLSDPTGTGLEGQSQRGAYENGAKDCLPNAVQSGGQLSADWVELLMGLPLHWTSMEEDAGPMRDDPWGEGWEDGVPRVIVGQTNRVNRLKCLGNAVVPQCANYIGRLILDMESGRADGKEG